MLIAATAGVSLGDMLREMRQTGENKCDVTTFVACTRNRSAPGVQAQSDGYHGWGGGGGGRESV